MSGFEITVDGRPVPVREGQTIGAALLASGVRATRRTRLEGRPRGLFCGIGVCFDCLVTVNDEHSLRACQVVARPGDTVSTVARHRTTPPTAAPAERRSEPEAPWTT